GSPDRLLGDPSSCRGAERFEAPRSACDFSGDTAPSRSPSSEAPIMPSDAFVGRERELRGLRALLSSGIRLVTITGTAGVGKTRIARELVRADPRLVAFCDVSRARSEEEVCVVVARALGIVLPVGPATLSVARVGAVLAARSALEVGGQSVLVL